MHTLAVLFSLRALNYPGSACNGATVGHTHHCLDVKCTFHCDENYVCTHILCAYIILANCDVIRALGYNSQNKS